MSYIYLFKQYWKYSAGHHAKVIAILILYSINGLIDISLPLIFAQILNVIQTALSEDVLEGVTRWTMIWVLATIVSSIIPRIARYMREGTAFRIKQAFINEHYNIVTNLPLAWHVNNHSGSVINRINVAAQSLYTFALDQYIYMRFIIKLPGVIIALYYLNVSTSIFVMTALMVVVSILVMRLFDRVMVKQFRKLNEINHRISATIFDFISNIRTIITLKLGDKTRKDLNDKVEEGYKTTMYVRAKLDNIKFSTLFILVEIPKIGIIFYYIYSQLKTQSTVLAGNVAALFQYLTKIAEIFRDLIKESQNLMRYRTDMESVLPITQAIVDAKECGVIGKKWSSIKVDDVSFSYDGKKEIVKGVGFDIKRGNKIAIIGESGSGKSTLMSLIRGLYEANSGKIIIDEGKKNLEFNCLSKITTLMPQDPEIFENTILYNITMGLHYPDALVKKVIEISCFDKVLVKLPNGLDTDIREKGVNLSGGERQRLALARNLLAAYDSDIILMDEPTSSVDMKNEKQIYQNIFEFYNNKTIISSVHKVYLLAMFDDVFAMEKGVLKRHDS